MLVAPSSAAPTPTEPQQPRHFPPSTASWPPHRAQQRAANDEQQAPESPISPDWVHPIRAFTNSRTTCVSSEAPCPPADHFQYGPRFCAKISAKQSVVFLTLSEACATIGRSVHWEQTRQFCRLKKCRRQSDNQWLKAACLLLSTAGGSILEVRSPLRACALRICWLCPG